MPPEPLPWERKDYFERRKHSERSSDAFSVTGGGGGSGGGGATPRWRESAAPYHYGSSRDYSRSDDSRRFAQGYYNNNKQGGYQFLAEESNGYGCAPSRSSGEDDCFNGRPSPASLSRMKNGYGGNHYYNRENRGSFGQRDYYWRGDRQQSQTVRQQQYPTHDEGGASHREVDQSRQDNQIGSSEGLDVAAGRRCDVKDNSLGSMTWKSMKWSRSGGLSVRYAGGGSKTEPDLDERGPEETQLRSDSPRDGVVVKCLDVSVESPRPPSSEEAGNPKKKQRLGWGQGLAKREKKVEGPPEDAPKGAYAAQCVVEGDAKVLGASECGSPATQFLAACNSSPCVEEKLNMKANNEQEANDSGNSLGYGVDNFPENFPINLEKCDHSTNENISSLIHDLLQHEDASSGDSSYVRHSAMRKLLLLKAEVSKEIEKTESEIDMFENELKSFVPENVTSGFHPIEYESSQTEIASSILEKSAHVISDLPPEGLVLSSDAEPEKPCGDSLRECQTHVKDEDIDSPGSATSNVVKDTSQDPGGSILSKGSCLLSPPNRKMPAAECDPGGENGLSVSCSGSISPDFALHTDLESTIVHLIFSSNKDSAREASEILDRAVPGSHFQSDIWGMENLFLNKLDEPHLKKKIVTRKNSLRFKERVLMLQFRAFHHLWKEDARLLSVRKGRPKSQKRFELSFRSSQNAHQKHQPSICSRVALPDIIEYTRKLMSDPQTKLYRNNLKMPSLILDEKERKQSRFISNNSLVDDPCALEMEKATINPWTSEEKKIFMDMLATFGKDFSKIASHLSHKTTADCIEFYYKNHKSESFREVKKKLEFRKQMRTTNTYLVASGKILNRDSNSCLVGTASVVAEQTDGNIKAQHRYPRSSISVGYDYHMSNEGDNLLERTIHNDISGNEATAADVLAGMCGALSSEAVSSCVTSAVDPVEGYQERKRQKANHIPINGPYMPDGSQHFIDEDDTCSDKGSVDLDTVDWTDEEKSSFIRALKSFGKDFTKISRSVGTRSTAQCKIFFSKARKCLGLDGINQVVRDGRNLMSGDNGESSDTDDAGAAEMDSAICSTQSCSKTDVDFTQSVTNATCEEYGPPENCLLQIEPEKSCDKDELRAGPMNCEGDATQANNRLSGREENCQTGMIPEYIFREGADVAGTLSNCDSSVQLSVVDGEMKEREVDTVVSPAEPIPVEGSGGADQSKQHSLTDVLKDVGQTITTEVSKFRSSSPQLLMTKTGLHDKLDKQVCTDANDARISSPLMDLNTTGNICHAMTDSFFHQIDVNVPNCQPPLSMELLPCSQKPHVARKQKDSPTFLPANLISWDPSSLNYENGLHKVVIPPSTLSFREHGTSNPLNSLNPELHQRSHLLNPSLNQNRADSRVLRDYPIQVLNTQVLNGDIVMDDKKSAVPENYATNGDDPTINISSANGYNENHNDSRSLHLPVESPPEPKTREDLDDHPRYPQVRSHSDSEGQSRRSGDVKLFGQILSHPSQSLKSKPARVGENKAPTPLVLNLPSTEVDEPLVHHSSNHGMSSRPSLEDLQISRSCGMWDRNHVQATGFDSSAESLMLVAGYARACRLEQDALEGLMRGRRGSSIPSTTIDHNSNGTLALDFDRSYRVASNCDMGIPEVEYHPHVLQKQVQQPQLIQLERRRPRDVLLELQKRGVGFDGIPGFQQPLCYPPQGTSALTDPVVAIKRHYARHAGIQSDDDSWRDLGR
ncbi:hypothetical protein QJS10_CPA07g01084 [Acorus calamus]|uniref:SANT domain-containing protein n=1 Tax=Acorus calamus TaxID=4465 RepID=A0AAV9EHH5_ACOCL|nr:hypothetical protein QJS10_CPA07g01084 [Acorus calamus]